MKKFKASIALITLIVISAVSLILVAGVSVASISNYESAFEQESARTSFYAAEACLEESLIRLEADNSFAGTGLYLDADTSCSSVVSSGSPYVISIQVDFLNHSETYQAEVELTNSGQIYNSELLTWGEI